MTEKNLPPRPLSLGAMGASRIINALNFAFEPFFNQIEGVQGDSSIVKAIEIRIPYTQPVLAPPTVSITGSLRIDASPSSVQHNIDSIDWGLDHIHDLRERILDRVNAQLDQLLNSSAHSFTETVSFESTVKLPNNRQVILKSSLELTVTNTGKPRITLVAPGANVHHVSSRVSVDSLTNLSKLDRSKYDVVSYLPAEIEVHAKQVFGAEIEHRDPAEWELPITAYGDKVVIVSPPGAEVMTTFASEQQYYEEYTMTVSYMDEVSRPLYK